MRGSRYWWVTFLLGCTAGVAASGFLLSLLAAMVLHSARRTKRGGNVEGMCPDAGQLPLSFVVSFDRAVRVLRQHLQRSDESDNVFLGGAGKFKGSLETRKLLGEDFSGAERATDTALVLAAFIELLEVNSGLEDSERLIPIRMAKKLVEFCSDGRPSAASAENLSPPLYGFIDLVQELPFANRLLLYKLTLLTKKLLGWQPKATKAHSILPKVAIILVQHNEPVRVCDVCALETIICHEADIFLGMFDDEIEVFRFQAHSTKPLRDFVLSEGCQRGDPESTGWLNALLERIFLEKFGSGSSDTHQTIQSKLLAALNADPPDFVSKINVTRLNLGSSLPVFHDLRQHKTLQHDDLCMSMDINYESTSTHLDLDIVCNLFSFQFNIPVKIVLKGLKGHLVMLMPRSDEGMGWMTFEQTPDVDLRVDFGAPAVTQQMSRLGLVSEQIKKTTLHLVQFITRKLEGEILKQAVAPFWQRVPLPWKQEQENEISHFLNTANAWGWEKNSLPLAKDDNAAVLGNTLGEVVGGVVGGAVGGQFARIVGSKIGGAIGEFASSAEWPLTTTESEGVSIEIYEVGDKGDDSPLLSNENGNASLAERHAPLPISTSNVGNKETATERSKAVSLMSMMASSAVKQGMHWLQTKAAAAESLTAIEHHDRSSKTVPLEDLSKNKCKNNSSPPKTKNDAVSQDSIASVCESTEAFSVTYVENLLQNVITRMAAVSAAQEQNESPLPTSMVDTSSTPPEQHDEILVKGGLQTDTSEKVKTLRVGDAVQARYGVGQVFFPATVRQVNEDGTVDIIYDQYDDGDEDDQVTVETGVAIVDVRK